MKNTNEELKLLNILLKMSVSLMIYSVSLNRINITIKSRVKVIKLRRKIICNHGKQHCMNKLYKTKHAINAWLNQHILSNLDRYKINTNF